MDLKERLEGKCYVVGREILKSNEIPSITVFGENLPEAWENAVLATWEFGAQIRTEYDIEGNPNSRDASMVITVVSPFDEPRVHRSFYAPLRELEIYTQDVVRGVYDWRVGKGRTYSYHDRLFNWPGIDGWENIKDLVSQEIELPHVDQIASLTKKLSSTPYSRRAQAITWNPPADIACDYPPCLQRIWCRVVRSDEGIFYLQMNAHWRSRDALKAAFENIYALTTLQKVIAAEISELTGHDVLVGRYVDMSDSFHIYGSDVKRGEVERFLKILNRRSFEERTWRTDNYSAQRESREGREKIEKELALRPRQPSLSSEFGVVDKTF